MRLTVIGNGTIDISLFVENIHESVLEGNHPERRIVSFSQNNVSRSVITEAPKSERYRLTTGTIDDLIRGYQIHSMSPGGGGPNSALAARQIDSSLEISYFDITRAYSLVTGEFHSANVGSYFHGFRDPPLNVLLLTHEMLEGVKIPARKILKGPKLERIQELKPNFQGDLSDSIKQSDAVLMNSVKDMILVDFVLSQAKDSVPVYAVLTDSLPRNYAFERIIPVANLILNRSDLQRLAERSRYLANPLDLNSTTEMMLSLSRDMDPNKKLYVHDGVNGIFYLADNHIGQIKLGSEHVGPVQRGITRRNNGSGDFLTAAIVLSDANGIPPSIVAANSQMQVVLMHLSYNGELPTEAYQSIIHPVERKRIQTK